MQTALEQVAARSPHLTGTALVDALASTGWVDTATARRLLPQFRHFDPDAYFNQMLRRLSFRGATVAPEFRQRVGRVVEELTGDGRLGEIGPEEGIRFRRDETEGIVFAYPEVSLGIGRNLREAMLAAVEEMPDAVVVVARNFRDDTEAQLSDLLSRTSVPGTLVTVNLLLGMRAVALRYQPCPERVLGLLGAGRALRSTDIALLGNRS